MQTGGKEYQAYSFPNTKLIAFLVLRAQQQQQQQLAINDEPDPGITNYEQNVTLR